MYERFFGFREKPFSLTPDPEFLFLTSQHKDALEQMLYGIQRREGFTVILGDVGTGKTTLCWALLGKIEGTVRTALVLNPLLTEEEVLRAIVQDFGVPPDPNPGTPAAPDEAGGDSAWLRRLGKTDLIEVLNRFLLDRAAAAEFCVLILDEAQGLSSPVLEQLRLLSNLETAKKKLLQIIFVGQLEFEEKLKLPGLRSLNQRISIRYRIGPLSREETAEYIRYRIRVAGGSSRLEFTPGAVRAVYRYSRGYPRLVNLVCDRALLAGFSETSFRIGSSMVRKAVRGLGGTNSLGRSPLRSRGIGIVAGSVALLALAAVTFTIAFGELPTGGRIDATTEPAAMPQSQPEEAVRQPTAGFASDQPPHPSTPVAMDPEERERPVEPPDATKGGGTRDYYIQVHSLRRTNDAEAAVADLRASDFEAFTTNEGAWQVVYVGPFTDRTSADAAARRLSVQFHCDPILRLPGTGPVGGPPARP